jgi:NAD-dependent dihydropyrimidine dehydrogenase PreA subunit
VRSQKWIFVESHPTVSHFIRRIVEIEFFHERSQGSLIHIGLIQSRLQENDEIWDIMKMEKSRGQASRSRRQVFVVSDDLCSGCRNCEMWCSFLRNDKKGFNPSDGNIKILKDDKGVLNRPIVNCGEKNCSLHSEQPICVEMCPTGCLIFTNAEDLKSKRLEFESKRKEQPVFKVIAPWKYPYPWRKLEREND